MNRRKVLRWILWGLGIVLVVVAIVWLLPERAAPETALITGTPLPLFTPEPTPTLHPGTPPGENASLVCSTSLIVIIIIGAVLLFRLRKPPSPPSP